jgi:hypothetical protein
MERKPEEQSTNIAQTPTVPEETYLEMLKRLRGKYKTQTSAVDELLEERRQESELKGY